MQTVRITDMDWSSIMAGNFLTSRSSIARSLGKPLNSCGCKNPSCFSDTLAVLTTGMSTLITSGMREIQR